MKTSNKCLQAIKEFEGCELEAYRCKAGVLTIGYGHTRGVKAGQKISINDAEKFLREDIIEVENQISNVVKQNLSQCQFDAVVSFVFNIGIGKFKTSTLLKKINANVNDKSIGNEFRRWVYCNGRKLSGLIKRREWEALRYYESV